MLVTRAEVEVSVAVIWGEDGEHTHARTRTSHTHTHQQLEESNASRSVLVSLLQISSLDERVALVHHFLSTPTQQYMQEHSYHT